MILSTRQPVKAPEPGIYPSIGPADYHRWAAASQTTLKNIGVWDQAIQIVAPGPDATPAHVKDWLDSTVEESTEAQMLGTWQHALLLEPERFGTLYRAVPKIDKRTKEGKQRWADLVAQYGENHLIPEDDWQMMQAMARGIARVDFARQLVGSEGQTEVSITWRDATGIDCKARLDKLIQTPGRPPIIADIKTTRCAHWNKFERDFAQYGYDQQAAWYVDALAAHGLADAKFFIIAIEKTAPYLCVVYGIPPEVIDAGRTKNKAALEVLRQCLETSSWPGYADDRLVPISLPSWAHAEYQPA